MTGTPCSTCIHFDPSVKDKNVCKAFPEGIPTVIAVGENSHRKPFSDDNGYRWEPIEGFEFLKEGEGKI